MIKTKIILGIVTTIVAGITVFLLPSFAAVHTITYIAPDTPLLRIVTLIAAAVAFIAIWEFEGIVYKQIYDVFKEESSKDM